jgi:serine/threonine protein kinase
MAVVLSQPISFGKYTLMERIGRGGMADVFKACVQGPAGFERTLVFKKILPHLANDPSFTHMFIEEAKLAAKLNHPNIVQVFELGAENNEYFMSMEYVRGKNVAEIIRALWAHRVPPRAEVVAYIGREICRALAYIHDFKTEDEHMMGMIHRDISPSNIMLTYDGSVKLLDFGIAKVLRGKNPEKNTKIGTLKGKFAYMAPEQTVSTTFDQRVDIFSTGIVLHEILTGRHLFKGKNDFQTIDRVRRCKVAPPSLHNPFCPPQLDAIVLKALSKHPDDRFQSATEMAAALDEVVFRLRFKTSQMAHLMGSLFPTDAEAETLSGVTEHETPSPTTLPVFVNQDSLSIVPLKVASANALKISSNWLPRPLMWPAIAFLAVLIGFSFIGGVYIADRKFGQVERIKSTSQTQKFEVVFRSIPSGADVYRAGTNEYLGKTPFQYTLKDHQDLPTFVVFRLAGYQDVPRQVNTTWPAWVEFHPTSPSMQIARARGASHPSISTKMVKVKRTKRSASKKLRLTEPTIERVGEERVGEKATSRLKANPFS